jgi:hypothetical protein
VAPLTITDQVRRAIWSVDKDQPVWSIYSLETAVDRTQGQSKFLGIAAPVFSAAVALLLASGRDYGVTSYGARSGPTRSASGSRSARSSDRVLRDVVGRGVRLMLIAVAIGVAGAIGMGRLAAAVLFGVHADRSNRARRRRGGAGVRWPWARPICRRDEPRAWIRW